MTRRPGIADARPRGSPFWQALSRAAAVLLVGFLFVQTPVGAALFAAVAQVLAVCATACLGIAGFDIVRSGTEIRDTLSGHAIVVTAACDGSGLLVGAVAAFVWLRVRTAAALPLAGALAIAVAAILAFNLIRILALFVSIGAPSLMSAQHLLVAPLLSAMLVMGLALAARRLRPLDIVAHPAVWLTVALATALGWYVVADQAGCALLVGPVNALLYLLPGGVAGHIACEAGAATLVTTAVASSDAMTPIAVPFFPADFALATPLVVATLACLRSVRAILRGVLASLALFSTAMAVAAVTASNDAAIAAGASFLAGPSFMLTYRAPGDLHLAALKAIQNVLVHFNLFLLPVVLAEARPAAKATPPPPRTAAPNRPRRRAR